MTLQDLSVLMDFYLQGRNVIFSKEEFARLLNVAQLKYYKKLLGLPEQYQPGMPVPKEAYEITRLIDAKLDAFNVVMGQGGMPLLPIDEDGVADCPDDLYFASSIRYDYERDGVVEPKDVVILTDKEYNKRISSYINRPNLKYPICNFYGGKIRFAPITLKYVAVSYLRLPDVPVYAVTTARGFQEYDSVNSVELEWGDVEQLDILSYMLSDFGVNVGSADLVNMAERIKTIGE